MVADAHARFSVTRHPVADCSTCAYASVERSHAVSASVGSVSGALPTPAAVESPMTTTSMSARVGPAAVGGVTNGAVPVRSASVDTPPAAFAPRPG